MPPPSTPTARRARALAPLLVAACGCAGTARFAPPDLAAGVTHFVGRPLGGPRGAGGAAPRIGELVALDAELWIARGAPAGGERLADRARLLIGTGTLAPLRASPRIDPGVRLYTGPDGRSMLRSLRADPDSVSVARIRGILGEHLTAVFGAVERAALEPLAPAMEGDARAAGSTRGDARAALLPVGPGVRAALSPSGEGRLRLHVALAGEPQAAFADDSSSGGAADGRARFGEREEIAVDDLARPHADPLVIAVPWALDGTRGEDAAATLYLALRERPLGGADATAALEAALEDDARAGDWASRAGRLLTPEEFHRDTLREAVRRLDDARDDRGALVVLADVAGARFASDLAVVAPDAELQAWLASFGPLADSLVAESGPVGSLGWRLERAAWTHAIGRLSAAAASDSIAVLLERHAGEVSRFPALLAEIVASSGGEAELRRRLVEENLRFLEEGQPGPRVRAFDWLAAQGLGPAGFDPLGPREARAAALGASRSATRPAGGDAR